MQHIGTLALTITTSRLQTVSKNTVSREGPTDVLVGAVYTNLIGSVFTVY